MAKRSRANQGQVLIIAALVIVMMMLSTALYIADIQKSQLKVQAETSLNLPFYKQGLQHTMIGALVNISNGGATSTLQTNINSFNQFVSDHSFDAFFTSTVTLRSTLPYQSGVWRTQNSSGTAVFSAYASFSVTSSGTKETTQSTFDMNVTSMIQNQGYYNQQGRNKQAYLTCRVYNEGQPALARNFSISYESDGDLGSQSWINVTSPTITDNGDGSYAISFSGTTDQPKNPVIVWLSCRDQRGIMLQTLVSPVLQ